MTDMERAWKYAPLYRALGEVFAETRTLLHGRTIMLTCDPTQLKEAERSKQRKGKTNA